MSEPKFTPGPWFINQRHSIVRIRENETDQWRRQHPFCVATMVDGDSEIEEANANLIAASPELYDNEEKNLTLLKTILKCYEDVEKLMLIDKDVQAAIQNETIKGIMMPEVMHLITEDLKTRITETERVLAKARGDSNNA